MSRLRHCQRLEGMLAPVVLALHQHKNVWGVISFQPNGIRKVIFTISMKTHAS